MQYEAYHAYDEFEFSRAAAHLLWDCENFLKEWMRLVNEKWIPALLLVVASLLLSVKGPWRNTDKT